MVGVLLAGAALLAGCARSARPPAGQGGDADHGACARLSAVRQVRAEALCEDAWTCSRPPNGPWDRIGLRRIAACRGGGGAVVLYFPGMHMNAELPATDAATDLRLHLALAGHRVWGIDWRPHAVSELDGTEARRAVASWDRSVFVEDAAWALRFVQGAEAAPVFVVGFSYGAGIAYELASRETPGLQGLVILDGAPTTGRPTNFEGPLVDVGTDRLPWEARRRLLEAVIANPDGPSPVHAGRRAGRALAELLWTDPGFGGRGGLSAAREGVSDIRVVARLLSTYDRWWPAAALGGPPPSPPRRPIPLIAFASGNLGPAWIDRVRAGARAFGGETATVRVLPLHGHLDILVGALAAEEVYEAVRRWLEARADASRPVSHD